MLEAGRSGPRAAKEQGQGRAGAGQGRDRDRARTRQVRDRGREETVLEQRCAPGECACSRRRAERTESGCSDSGGRE